MPSAAEENTSRLLPGQLLGRNYRVLRPLAKGGMGAVYEVEQLATGARRALKVMHHKLAGDPDFRRRFEQEARVSATIRSDHVAQVIDAGVDEETGLLFIVMELLEGVTLGRETKRRGYFEWAEVAEIFRQLCHALARAHAAGVVHLDLKPANVFLARARLAGASYIVKVLDFGIAKFEHSPLDAVGAVGTPGWMAPEQARTGAPLEPAADVWALGLLAFYLATGRSYWLASNDPSTKAIVEESMFSDERVPASSRAREFGLEERIFPGFDEWFARCLKRRPADRFANAALAYEALLSALKPVLSRRPVSLVASAHVSEGDTIPPMAPAVDAENPTAELSLTDASGVPTVDASAPARPSGAAPIAATLQSVQAASVTAEPSLAAPSGARRLRLGLGVLAAAVLLGAGVLGVGVLRRGSHPGDASASASASALGAAAKPKAPLFRMHGANTIGADLGPLLAESYLRKRTGARAVVRRRTAEGELAIEAKSDGSGAVLEWIEIHAHTATSAFTDLGNGSADIGMASRRISNEELGQLASLGALSSSASEQVIALDGIAVVVNPENPLTTLRTEQLASLFAGERTDWADVGGVAGKVRLVAPAEGSGTWTSISGVLLGKRPLAANATREESAERLSDTVAADKSAIGLVGLGYVRRAKILALQEGEGAPRIPSALSVATEDYPLARRLYLYTPTTAPAAAREFIDFATSDEAQPIVAAAGFVDLLPECDTKAATCEGCAPEQRALVAGTCRVSLDFRFDPRTGQLDSRALRDLERVGRLLATPQYAAKSVLLFGFAYGDAKTAVARSKADADGIATQLRARSLTVNVVRGLGAQMSMPAETEAEAVRRSRRVQIWLR